MHASPMNQARRKIKTAAALAALVVSGAADARGEVVSYTTKHVFSIADTQCEERLFGPACLSRNPIRVEKDGVQLYGIDSAFGYDVADFDPEISAEPRPRDGQFNEGFVGNIHGGEGLIGLRVVTTETPKWKRGPLRGEWLAGLGGNSVKAETEHYPVMDHVLNAEWMPPLVAAEVDPVTGEITNVADYNVRPKDDGKLLFFWGNLSKSPTEVRIYATMDLPEAWKAPGANYTVTSAKLRIHHTITTSPNDQIRPEDFENENAKGIQPQYTICPQAPATAPQACGGLPDGTWVSAINSVEGDGHVIPAGTVLRNVVPLTYDYTGDGVPDYVDYFTNAWYTTLDRDPFGGSNPRYRLKSSKLGQDLPGVELPQYEAGTVTTTTIDLLSIRDQHGQSILAQSANWDNYLDVNPEKGDFVEDNMTIDGSPLTPDFDLRLFVKGEQKGIDIYSAELLIQYLDPDHREPPSISAPDVWATEVSMPQIMGGQTGDISISLHNKVIGAASGYLYLLVEDENGTLLDSYSTSFETTADSSPRILSFPWTAPLYRTTVKAIATAAHVVGEINLDNNSASSILKINQIKGK